MDVLKAENEKSRNQIFKDAHSLIGLLHIKLKVLEKDVNKDKLNQIKFKDLVSTKLSSPESYYLYANTLTNDFENFVKEYENDPKKMSSDVGQKLFQLREIGKILDEGILKSRELKKKLNIQRRIVLIMIAVVILILIIIFVLFMTGVFAKKSNFTPYFKRHPAKQPLIDDSVIRFRVPI